MIRPLIGNLQRIVDGLRSANYRNNKNELISDPAFLRLEQRANTGREAKGNLSDADTYFFDESPLPEEPFHIEADIYDSGYYANLLVIPANGNLLLLVIMIIWPRW